MNLLYRIYRCFLLFLLVGGVISIFFGMNGNIVGSLIEAIGPIILEVIGIYFLIRSVF